MKDRRRSGSTKLRDFLGTFGLQLTGGDDPQAKDYAKLIDKIQNRPDKQLLQTVMLRSLQAGDLQSGQRRPLRPCL